MDADPDAAWGYSRRAFHEAAEWFVRTTTLVGDRWELPGLGEWDVRALVGHASRSFLTVESYLAQPAASVEVATTEDYYLAISSATAGPAVAQRGRDAGAALGPDPLAAVAEIAARVGSLVESLEGSELLTTIAGGMRLADYLPTRTFELTVHTCDLAVALGEPLQVPALPATQALAIVTELGVTRGLAGSLLLLATGRPVVAPGFTVL